MTGLGVPTLIVTAWPVRRTVAERAATKCAETSDWPCKKAERAITC